MRKQRKYYYYGTTYQLSADKDQIIKVCIIM